MTPPDVRAFYAALGIQLPVWSACEAPVRCFSHPDAHNHADRSPSCSVNLTSGAWNCHGCGAHGGAYDAATAVGHTPRSAMDLLISHGLAEPRTAGPRVSRSSTTRGLHAGPPPPASTLAVRAGLGADEDDVRRWATMLHGNSSLITRLMLERAWMSAAIKALGVGFDGERITIPLRDPCSRLRGVLRFDPFGRRDPKMLAVPGTHLGLVPHPAREPSDRILLVEGPPDMIAARSCGLPAIAIPGVTAWRPAWAKLLADKRVRIVMDCDTPGRRAAQRIATSLDQTAETVEVVDLAPERHDGYDLTDRIIERGRTRSPSPAKEWLL
ncbi:MAG: toprim domain-containing protein [Solirubrobacteraceae bacterium]